MQQICTVEDENITLPRNVGNQFLSTWRHIPEERIPTCMETRNNIHLQSLLVGFYVDRLYIRISSTDVVNAKCLYGIPLFLRAN